MEKGEEEEKGTGGLSVKLDDCEMSVWLAGRRRAS